MEEASTTNRSKRVDHILRSAIPVFAQHGYRRTSMQLLADAAGISRPALYQYFADRAAIFLSAFQLLLDENTDAALIALTHGDSLEFQIDGYLQRLVGDPYATLSSSNFGDELMEIKGQLGGTEVSTAIGRASHGLLMHVAALDNVDQSNARQVVELITLAVGGLKQDRPSVEVFRERLTFLARSAALTLNQRT